MRMSAVRFRTVAPKTSTKDLPHDVLFVNFKRLGGGYSCLFAFTRITLDTA